MNDKIGKILNKLKRGGNFAGVLLSNRDGELNESVDDVKESLNSKEYDAMCASALKSAENLGHEISNRKVVKIISELENYTILFIGCTEKTFLTLITHNESKVNLNPQFIQNYVNQINEVRE